MCGSRERYSTPIKSNKFVYSYSGILSTSEQVNGSFRRLHDNVDKYEQRHVTPSKQYFGTPDFSFANRNHDTDDKIYLQNMRQVNAQRRANNLNDRLLAKAKFNSSPYERLVAPLRISSISSTVDSQEPHASANTVPSQTAQKDKIKQNSANLCYCVPEFSNLDLSVLPDTNDLLSVLQEKLDCQPESLRIPFNKHSFEEAKVEVSTA